jgi:hypothetical protein
MAFLALLVILLALGLWKPSEPCYREKPLSYWLQEAPMLVQRGDHIVLLESHEDRFGRRYGACKEFPSRAVAAIQAIGTNGLPFILHRLARSDLPMQAELEQYVLRLGFDMPPWDNRAMQRAQAVAALVLLSPLPASASNSVLRLARSRHQQISAAAKLVLDGATPQTEDGAR